LSPTGTITATTLSEAKSVVAGLSGKSKEHGNLYLKVIEKVLSKGPTYVTDERARLNKMVAGGNMSADKKTLFLVKSNILDAFSQQGVTQEL
jgi:methylmalonyl-CoA mutase cobalamin-binding subunit